MSSLQNKINLWIVLAAIVMAAASSTLGYTYYYERERKVGLNNVDDLIETVRTAGSIAAYVGNDELAKEVVLGLARHSLIAHASVESQDRLLFSSLNHSSSASPSNIQWRNYPLYSPVAAGEQVGEIKISLNNHLVHENAKHAAMEQIYLLAAYTILLVVVLTYVVRKILIHPLSTIAKELHTIEPGASRMLSMNTEGRKDEIAVLVKDINVLLVRLNNALSQEKKEKEKIKVLADHDQLTGLLNRRAGIYFLNNLFYKNRGNGSQFAVILFDLDKFKQVNDNHGHESGDIVLKTVASRLKSIFRDNDILIRWGGDEFVVCFPIKNIDNIAVACNKIVDTVTQRIALDTDTFCQVGSSIGVSLFPSGSRDLEDLIGQADLAMYYSKANNGNRFTIYQQGMELQRLSKPLPNQ